MTGQRAGWASGGCFRFQVFGTLQSHLAETGQPLPNTKEISLIAPAPEQVPMLSGTANSLHNGPHRPRTAREVVCVSQREAVAFPRVEMQREGANLGEVGNVLFLLSPWLWRFVAPSLSRSWKSFTQQLLRENLPESPGQGMSAASFHPVLGRCRRGESLTDHTPAWNRFRRGSWPTGMIG